MHRYVLPLLVFCVSFSGSFCRCIKFGPLLIPATSYLALGLALALAGAVAHLTSSVVAVSFLSGLASAMLRPLRYATIEADSTSVCAVSAVTMRAGLASAIVGEPSPDVPSAPEVWPARCTVRSAEPTRDWTVSSESSCLTTDTSLRNTDSNLWLWNAEQLRIEQQQQQQQQQQQEEEAAAVAGVVQGTGTAANTPPGDSPMGSFLDLAATAEKLRTSCSASGVSGLQLAPWATTQMLGVTTTRRPSPRATVISTSIGSLDLPKDARDLHDQCTAESASPPARHNVLQVEAVKGE